MKEVIAIFIKQKSLELSKSKRIDEMHDIIQNKFYNKTWSKSDRLIACELMKEIINEDENQKIRNPKNN